MRGQPEIFAICHWVSPWRVSLVAQLVKNLTAMWETWVRSLGWEDPRRRKRLPTPVFWPGEFHGLYSAWDHKESDMRDDVAQPCLPGANLFPYNWPVWEKKTKQNILFTEYAQRSTQWNKCKDLSEFLSKMPGIISQNKNKEKKKHTKNVSEVITVVCWRQPVPTQEILLLNFQEFGKLFVSLESHY